MPSSLGKLELLQSLDLSNNMLRGRISTEFFTIPKKSLLEFFLSNNSLDGPIPEQIGNLRIIQSIDVSGNHFTGGIPPSIGDCTSLRFLNLSRNRLQGQIPSTLANIKSIELLDLSSNDLSGEIPSSLDSLQYLQELHLSMNQLRGPVPLTGVFKNTTAVSLSGNPQLCGGIPELNLLKCNLPITKHAKRTRVKLTVGLVVGIFVAVLLLGLALILLLSRKRQKQKTAAFDTSPNEGKYKLYTYYDIKSGTGNFSLQNLIGRGSFGSVYKAAFTDGTIAAVKVFNLEQRGASRSFIAECEALRNVRHRNLMKIISVSSSGKFKALILPFMPNRSLEEWLHGRSVLHEVDGGLDLSQRLKIIREVASALEYLHHGCETPIVHCDLKPSNVLLDEDMSAYVADFGIARILNSPDNHPTSSTLGLKGSIGYIAPEYGLGGEVSTKGDVYSFGIMLLEILSGKKPIDEEFTGTLDLQGWVATGISKNITDILDHNLMLSGWNSTYSDGIISIFDHGLRCAAKSPAARPTMREMSTVINNIVAKFTI